MSLPKIDLNVGSPDFEDVVAEAQASNNYKPLWNRLVKTRFFVAVKRVVNDGKADFRLVLDPSRPNIEISEYKDRLTCPRDAELAFLTGGQIVRRVPSEAALRIVLVERNLDVAQQRVDWLKRSLEASRQALIKKQEVVKPNTTSAASVEKSGDTLPPINAISMPMPDQEQQKGGGWDFRVSTLRADTNVPGAHAPVLTATPSFSYQSLELEPTGAAVNLKNTATPFDGSTIKKRHVSHAGLGIELNVPMTWQEIRNEKALKFVESERGIIVELNGRRREDMSYSSWLEMRIPLVTQELPALRRITDLEEVRGRNWKGLISGKVLEFQGMFFGDVEESVYRFYCLQTPTHFISIGIRAKVSQIEQLRPLLSWVVEGLDAYEIRGQVNPESSSNPYEPSSKVRHRVTEDAPSVISISLAGRIGRMRFVAYSLLPILPLVIAGVAIAMNVMANVAMAAGLVFFVILLIRPMVLRLHDLGISGKWLIALALLPGTIAYATGMNPHKFGQIFGAILYLVFVLIPGSSDENEYGPPGPPNSTAVTVIASIVLVLNVVGQVISYKFQDGAAFAGSSAETKESGFGFSPPDQTYSINFPRKPVEDLTVAQNAKAPGLRSARMYHTSLRKREYMVQELELERAPPDRSAALDTFSNFFSRSMGEIVSSEKTMLNGYAGRAVKLRTVAGNYQVLRFLFVGKRIFVLGVQAPNEKDAESEVDTFFGSFQATQN